MKTTQVDVVRAWKDQEYRESLSAEQRAALPANPAGLMELSDAELGSIEGGVFPTTVTGPCSNFHRKT
jgi:mersacidin/lichenicidin family type 2 lantibiotic